MSNTIHIDTTIMTWQEQYGYDDDDYLEAYAEYQSIDWGDRD